MQFSPGRHQYGLLGAYRRLVSTQRIPTSPIRAYSSSHPVACTSCGAPLPTRLPACPKCSHIERPTNKLDYYELLEMPKGPNPFIINESQLKNTFRRMQRYIHPDLWASQGKVRKDIYPPKSSVDVTSQDKTQVARDLSGLVNEAYNTLLQPLSRIRYILSQHSRDVSETDQLTDPHLIAEIIEIREGLEDASSESEVEEIKDNVAGSRETTYSIITS
jgi:molecular chaperone HscB